MKKRISSIRKIFVTVLAAALISGMTVPAAAFAQEAETQEDPVIMEEENSETELQKAEEAIQILSQLSVPRTTAVIALEAVAYYHNRQFNKVWKMEKSMCNT